MNSIVMPVRLSLCGGLLEDIENTHTDTHTRTHTHTHAHTHTHTRTHTKCMSAKPINN